VTLILIMQPPRDPARFIRNTFPTTNMAPADVVLGQASFGPAGYPVPPTASSMHFPACVYSDGTRFYVCDTNNNRVLVWDSC